MNCTHSVYDTMTSVCGRLSYCRIVHSSHCFIMVESGNYTQNVFLPDEKIRVAFSYVPDATFQYITGKYANRPAFQFYASPGDSEFATLVGYLPVLVTTAHVVDTWKLTDTYLRLMSRPILNWVFHRQPKFTFYHVLSILPWSGITDCIGYSNYHYYG